MLSQLNTVKMISLKTALILAFAGPIVTSVVWHSRQVFGDSEARQQPAPHIRLPPQYRDWRLISVAHEAGKLNDLRAVLGNDAAIEAYRSNTLPFPDGAIIARLAWVYMPSEENNKVFGQDQSFVAGSPTNVQLMVKDSRRYASTGGWGFAQFTDGKSTINDATDKCFSCHTPKKNRDYVFTRYAP